MNDKNDVETLAMALRLQSDAVVTFLDFLNLYFTGDYTREMLIAAAKERDVYHTDDTSDYHLWAGVLTSMRIDLRNMADSVKDRIKLVD